MNEPTDNCRELLALEREHNARLSELLEVDHVTGLPVRRAFDAMLAPRIAENDRFALSVIRLDDGYRRRPMSSEILAALLFSVGRRLSQFAPGRVYQSWRTDEFILLVDEPKALDDLEGYAARVREVVGRPVADGPFNIRLSCHVGFSVHPEHGSTVHELLTNAEIALGIVEQRQSTKSVYQHEMGARRRRQFEIEQAIGDAITGGLEDFALAFQPIVDRSGIVRGAEALMRWESRRLGPVSPGEFIPIAEQYGQIQLLGMWAIYRAATVAKGWKVEGEEPPVVTINVSAVQLREPDFALRATELIHSAGGDPRRFRFELTESAIVDRPEEATATLNALRASGIGLMIDDFGTGYSSFSYLHKLPIDTIKIAREFVETAPESDNSRAVIRSIISVAHDIGGNALAEGVESEEQLQILLAEGCDYFQGYYFGRPKITGDLSTLASG